MDPVKSKNLENSAGSQADRTSNGMDDFAVKVENVSKIFRLPHEKNSSIKTAVINFYKRKKGYELQKALNDVSFEVSKGEFFGIVGRNGSGKSTLLKLLAGIYTPTSGQVHVRGSLTPFIELGVGFNPELTGRENVFLNGALLGFSRKQMQAMYKDIVDFAELERFMDQKLKNYSSGMQVRLAFSIAVRARSDILLIDEVLAVGDADFQRKGYEYFKQLKKDKKTVVFVSHDMNAVKEFCDRGILIEDGEIKVSGTANEIAKEYSKIFLRTGSVSNAEQHSGRKERLGTGDVRVTTVKTSETNGNIVIDVTAKANINIEKMVYGLQISGEDGVEIIALNNRLIQRPDINDVKAGDTVRIKWEVLNIFTSGKYQVMLALVDDVGNPFDWYEDAASFNVRRKDRSTTSVIPPTKVSYSLVSKQ